MVLVRSVRNGQTCCEVAVRTLILHEERPHQAPRRLSDSAGPTAALEQKTERVIQDMTLTAQYLARAAVGTKAGV
jgi:hypothetical protein